MLKPFFSAALLVGASALSTAAGAATLVNGGFEDPDVTGAFDTFSAGSTAITGWTVTSGSVDVVDTLWIAAEGDQAIDLDGSAVGAIAQDITDLIIGTSYTISFAMSGNGTGAPAVKTMDVSVGGVTQSFSFDTALGNAANGTWITESLGFTASATSTTLSFSSTTGGNFYGPAIDDVRISAAPIPLPAGGALLLTGLAGLALARRRKPRG